MHTIKFTVLMCVYFKERSKNLSEALNSISGQTLLPNQIIIVKDGPLTEELEDSISNFIRNNEHLNVKVYSLKKNLGLGLALNFGLQKCSFDWVARMDSDDICKPERFELLVRQIHLSEGVSVIGTYIDEFVGSASNITQTRKVKLKHEEIANDLKLRNPMNHVSVIFSKNDVLKVGGYPDNLFFEDYYLWTKLIIQGKKFMNLSESTVLVRTGSDMIGRRHGVFYAKQELNIQKYLYEKNIINSWLFLRNFFLRVLIRVFPKFILNIAYKISRI